MGVSNEDDEESDEESARRAWAAPQGHRCTDRAVVLLLAPPPRCPAGAPRLSGRSAAPRLDPNVYRPDSGSTHLRSAARPPNQGGGLHTRLTYTTRKLIWARLADRHRDGRQHHARVCQAARRLVLHQRDDVLLRRLRERAQGPCAQYCRLSAASGGDP